MNTIKTIINVIAFPCVWYALYSNAYRIFESVIDYNEKHRKKSTGTLLIAGALCAYVAWKAIALLDKI